MSNTKKSIKAKFSTLIQQFKSLFVSNKPLTYEQYRKRQKLSSTYGTVTVKRTAPTVSVNHAPAERLTVPSNTPKRTVIIDETLYRLTGGKYGIIDRLEDDATSLVTA